MYEIKEKVSTIDEYGNPMVTWETVEKCSEETGILDVLDKAESLKGDVGIFIDERAIWINGVNLNRRNQK